MTDLYISRGGKPPRRSLPLLLLLLLCALAAAFLLHRHRPTQPPSFPPPPPENLPPPPPTPPSSPLPPDTTPSPFDFSPLRARLDDPASLLHLRGQLRSLLHTLPDPLDRLQAERLLGEVHTRLVFSDADMPEKVEHIVRPGETLGAIARKYGANLELIAASHPIRNNIILPGQRLRIFRGSFDVWVSKGRNELLLRLDGHFFKRYVVGTGAEGGTPAGDYVITLRMPQPVWYRPDGVAIPYGHPDNLLGTHYLKLNVPGIGLHGTWEPESIGSQSSAGCVRMLNPEIEELFLLLPEGTPVKIVD